MLDFLQLVVLQVLQILNYYLLNLAHLNQSLFLKFKVKIPIKNKVKKKLFFFLSELIFI